MEETFSIDSVKRIFLTKDDMENVSYEKFYAYMYFIGNEDLLQSFVSSEKYCA